MFHIAEKAIEFFHSKRVMPGIQVFFKVLDHLICTKM